MILTVHLHAETYANRKHLYELLYPFTKKNEALNTVNIGVLDDFKESDYQKTEGMTYLLSTQYNKSNLFCRTVIFMLVEFEDLVTSDIESYIRVHPIYPITLSYPLEESAIPEFVNAVLLISTRPTRIQGIRPLPDLFAQVYKDTLAQVQKKLISRETDLSALTIYSLSYRNFNETISLCRYKRVVFSLERTEI